MWHLSKLVFTDRGTPGHYDINWLVQLMFLAPRTVNFFIYLAIKISARNTILPTMINCVLGLHCKICIKNTPQSSLTLNVHESDERFPAHWFFIPCQVRKVLQPWSWLWHLMWELQVRAVNITLAVNRVMPVAFSMLLDSCWCVSIHDRVAVWSQSGVPGCFHKMLHNSETKALLKPTWWLELNIK